jgi:hypothetical protein
LRTRIAELPDDAAEEITVRRSKGSHEKDLADCRVRMIRRDGCRLVVAHRHPRRGIGRALQIGLQGGSLLRTRLVGRLVGVRLALLRSHVRSRPPRTIGAAQKREELASARSGPN